MKKILITGGSGFIGSHIAEKFLNENYIVGVVDLWKSPEIDKAFEWTQRIIDGTQQIEDGIIYAEESNDEWYKETLHNLREKWLKEGITIGFPNNRNMQN